jgi:hypothetical protein
MTLNAPLRDGVVAGAVGLWITGAHWRWRGPADPARWRVEHLTSFLGAYLILWWFVFWLYIRTLPRVAQTLIPATLVIAGLMWARRGFGPRVDSSGPSTSRASDSPRLPTVEG